MNMRSMLATGVLAPVLVFLAGCGSASEKTVSVRGKLMKGGVPFTAKEANGGKPLPPGDPGIRVKLSRTGTSGEEDYDVGVDGNTGTFEALGKGGKGVPPGHYKLSVYAGAYGSGLGKGDTSGGGPPKGGPPMAGGDAPSIGGPSDMSGRPIHTQEIDVPDSGLTDLVVDIKGK